VSLIVALEQDRQDRALLLGALPALVDDVDLGGDHASGAGQLVLVLLPVQGVPTTTTSSYSRIRLTKRPMLAPG
jgi:hypothetical protein